MTSCIFGTTHRYNPTGRSLVQRPPSGPAQVTNLKYKQRDMHNSALHFVGDRYDA